MPLGGARRCRWRYGFERVFHESAAPRLAPKGRAANLGHIHSNSSFTMRCPHFRGIGGSCFFFQSPMAARMASSREHGAVNFHRRQGQLFHDLGVLDLREPGRWFCPDHSVASDDDAIAEPQPKVLNLASSMTLVLRLTLICNFMSRRTRARNQAGADIGVLFIHGADVARIVVVVDYLSLYDIVHPFRFKFNVSRFSMTTPPSRQVTDWIKAP